MPDLAYLNGKIMPIEHAMVSIEDRGYQFGDGVYEFIASYGGRLFMLDAHLDRLQRSLDALDYPPVSRDSIRQAVRELVERSGHDRAGVYIQITRGVRPRDHAFAADMRPQVIMTVRPVKELPRAVRNKGASIITVPDIRWGRCDVKTVQLLANSLAKQQAIDSGHDDAVFISKRRVVREGTSSNLFIVTDATLATHPLDHAILPGITRQVVVDICRAGGLTVKETCFDTKALHRADEAFFTGTVSEVLAVTTVDDRPIGDGKVGPTTRRIYAELQRRALAAEPK
jgi:D-alanine transaminase